MKHIVATTTLAAMLGMLSAAAAQAGVGDGIASANVGGARIAQVENAQFLFGGQNFCWYDAGWQGPGWYWCGYAERTGLGWGGGEGFHGWGHSGHGPANVRPVVRPNNGQHFTNTQKFSAPKGGPKGGPKGPPKKP